MGSMMATKLFMIEMMEVKIIKWYVLAIDYIPTLLMLLVCVL